MFHAENRTVHLDNIAVALKIFHKATAHNIQLVRHW